MADTINTIRTCISTAHKVHVPSELHALEDTLLLVILLTTAKLLDNGKLMNTTFIN